MEPIYIKEDTAKPENRTNLALLSILQIDEIRTYLLRRLNVPEHSLVCPSLNVITEEFTNCGRPDFEIRNPQQKAIGYVEVEMGRENNAQITRYRSHINYPVYSIVGKASYTPSDLSLEEIRECALSIAPRYRHMQQEVSLKLFCDLVKWYIIDGNFRPSNARADLSERMLQSRLVQLILSRFGEENILPLEQQWRPERSNWIRSARTVSHSGSTPPKRGERV